MRKLYVLICLVLETSELISQTFINYQQSSLLLCNDTVYTIAIDQQGNKWFGTSNGVSEFDGTNWKSYTQKDGLADNHVTCMTIDASGNKWFGTRNGISKFTDTSWTTYYKRALYNAIRTDAENNVWVTSYPIPSWVPPMSGIVLSKFDGTNWDSIMYYDEPLYAIAIDSMNDLWISSDGTIIKYDGTSDTSYRCGMSASNYSLAIDKNGIIWTSDAYRFDGKNFVQVLKDGMIGNIYFQGRTMAIDNKNNKWFGTDTSGVWKYNDTTWTNFTTKDGLINNYVNCIAIDAENNKWFGTLGGISELVEKEVTALKKLTTIDVKLYPIPVIKDVTVSISEYVNQAIIEIFSIDGIKLCSYPLANKTKVLDMSNYPSGVYIVRINTLNNGVITKQIIKVSR